MHDRDDPRTKELINLRVALATFALHLDAFEARMSRLAKPAVAPRRLVTTNLPTFAIPQRSLLKNDRETPHRLGDGRG